MNIFFTSAPIWQEKGIALVRIILGGLLVFHGKEVFDPTLMESYTTWDAFKGGNGLLMVYIGKASELIAGILLFLGLFTRIGALICIGTLSYITFILGDGRFWYEEQHPFMFVLLGFLFLFTGPGAWSLDAVIFGKGAGKKS